MRIKSISIIPAVICMLLIVFTFMPTPTHAALADIQVCSADLFNAGNGSEEAPYEITTAQELANVTFCSGEEYDDSYFRLEANINLSGFESSFGYGYGYGYGWMPIGAYIEDSVYSDVGFYGTFDGNYHTVSNMSINREQNEQGLFGVIATGAIVSNFGLEESSVFGTDNIGGIAGILNGTLSRVYVSDSAVEVTSGFLNAAGGIVGDMGDGSVLTDAYVYDVAVSGGEDVVLGGIAGSVRTNASINRVYSSGSVTAEVSYYGSIGGVAGGEYTSFSIEDSFSVATTTADSGSAVGGMVGKWGEVVGENNYWLATAGNPEYCVASASVEEDVCSAVGDISYFKNIESEPIASWSIVTTDDSEYNSLNDGFPFLAWQKDGEDAESTWMIYTEEGETYVLSFDLQGGSPLATSTYIEEGSEVTLPAAPTKDGYEFLEWSTDSYGEGAGYEAGAAFMMPGADTTLYAIWIALEMEVTTGEASDISRTGATLQGTITNASEETGNQGFEYGETSEYGDTIEEESELVDGSYTLSISDLKCNTTYHYRAYVEEVSGEDATFKTSRCASTGGGGSSVTSSGNNTSVVTTTANTNTQENRAAVIANLQAQLAILMQQLAALTGETSTPAAPVSTVRDLEYGMEGEDVKMLQQVLINANAGPKAQALRDLEGSPTIYFVNYTEEALIEYQLKYGITPATGYWGEKTRTQMKAAGLGGLWW